MYLDNGRGGPFKLIYEGIPSSYSYLAGEAESLDCGYLYMVRVTASNVAGEGPYAAQSVYLGNVPSNPRSPSMLSVVPNSVLTISWERPYTDGCLPVKHYRVNKDGVDLPHLVTPSATFFADDISTGGSIGTEITYKVKAVNVNGESLYSEDFTVTIGVVPNPPLNLKQVKTVSQTAIQVAWEPGLAIASNPVTLRYKVFLDDGSGNEPVRVWDTETHALSNIATLTGLRTGHTYRATVTATNAIGEGQPSAALTIYTGVVPSKIIHLAWKDSSQTWVEFKWMLPVSDGGLSLSKFRIYFDAG